MTKGAGIPCGGSHISAVKTCRIEGGSTQGFEPNNPVWGMLSKDDSKKVAAAIDSIRQKVRSELPPEAHEAFDDALTTFLNENGAKETSDKKASVMISTLGRAETMVGNQPVKVKIGDDVLDAPDRMVPVIKRRQLSWDDPALGVKVNLPGKDGVAELKGTSLGKFVEYKSGDGKAMLDYRQKEIDAGRPWPTPKDPKNQPTPAQVDALAKKNPELWRSGFNIMDRNKGRDDAFDVYEVDKVTPSKAAIAARDSKTKAVAEAYLQQGGVSPVTGRKIDLPLDPKSTIRTTVDHERPISEYRDQFGGNMKKAAASANVANNFSVVETNLNNTKSAGSWNEAVGKIYTTERMVSESNRRIGSTGGAGVTMSRSQYVARYGEAAAKKSFDGGTTSRTKAASTREKERLSKVYGVPKSQIKTTASPPKKGGQGTSKGMAKYSDTKLNRMLKEAQESGDDKAVGKILQALAMKSA